MPSRVQAVCLAVGDLPNLYVTRLHSMLSRHMPVPFDLTCMTDRDRGLSSAIRNLDVSGWSPPRPGMRPTVYKLNLYDPVRVPLGELLFMDTSLVIQKDMTPFLEFAFSQPQELVAVKGLSYDTYNSCVLRIRQGGALTAIPKAYEAGETFDQRVPGDQDFATGVILKNGWQDRVTTFPKAMLYSYKKAREAEKERRGEGRRMLEEAIVVKFHGHPKMDELLDPLYRLRTMVAKGNPFHREARFWVRELRERWR